MFQMFLYLRDAYVCVVSFDSCLPDDVVFDVWRLSKQAYDRSFYFMVEFQRIDDGAGQTRLFTLEEQRLEEWISKASRCCAETLKVREIVCHSNRRRPAVGLERYLSLPWIRTLESVSIGVSPTSLS